MLGGVRILAPASEPARPKQKLSCLVAPPLLLRVLWGEPSGVALSQQDQADRSTEVRPTKERLWNESGFGEGTLCNSGVADGVLEVPESASSLVPLKEAPRSTRLKQSLWMTVLGLKICRVVGAAGSSLQLFFTKCFCLPQSAGGRCTAC